MSAVGQSRCGTSRRADEGGARGDVVALSTVSGRTNMSTPTIPSARSCASALPGRWGTGYLLGARPLLPSLDRRPGGTRVAGDAGRIDSRTAASGRGEEIRQVGGPHARSSRSRLMRGAEWLGLPFALVRSAVRLAGSGAEQSAKLCAAARGMAAHFVRSPPTWCPRARYCQMGWLARNDSARASCATCGVMPRPRSRVVLDRRARLGYGSR